MENGKPINYEKLGDELTKGDFRVRTFYYTGKANPNDLST